MWCSIGVSIAWILLLVLRCSLLLLGGLSLGGLCFLALDAQVLSEDVGWWRFCVLVQGIRCFWSCRVLLSQVIQVQLKVLAAYLRFCRVC